MNFSEKLRFVTYCYYRESRVEADIELQAEAGTEPDEAAESNVEAEAEAEAEAMGGAPLFGHFS